MATENGYWSSASDEQREKIRESSRRWKERNKEKVAEKSRQLYIKKREALLEKRRAGIHEYRTRVQNSRSASVGAEGAITAEHSSSLFDLQRGLCPCCHGELGSRFHIDHIVPLSKGGTNTNDNTQLLCHQCNLWKSDKDPVDFMQEMGFLC